MNKNVSKRRLERLIEVWESFMKRKIDEETIELMLSDVHEQLGLTTMYPIAGAERFYRELHKEMEIFIVSSAVTSEILEFLDRNLWEIDLRNIHTEVKNKYDRFREIIHSRQISANEILAVGDTHEDFEAAEMNKIDFWRISTTCGDFSYNSQYFKGCSINLDTLTNFIQS